jgi:hypothetical protein
MYPSAPFCNKTATTINIISSHFEIQRDIQNEHPSCNTMLATIARANASNVVQPILFYFIVIHCESLNFERTSSIKLYCSYSNSCPSRSATTINGYRSYSNGSNRNSSVRRPSTSRSSPPHLQQARLGVMTPLSRLV